MGEDSCNSLSLEQCTTQIGPKKSRGSMAILCGMAHITNSIFTQNVFKGTQFLQQHSYYKTHIELKKSPSLVLKTSLCVSDRSQRCSNVYLRASVQCNFSIENAFIPQTLNFFTSTSSSLM